MMLKLELTQDQVNTILLALGQMPFVQVSELISVVRKQCLPQLVEEKLEEEGPDGDTDTPV